jgi:hypothetical protein
MGGHLALTVGRSQLQIGVALQSALHDLVSDFFLQDALDLVQVESAPLVCILDC